MLSCVRYKNIVSILLAVMFAVNFSVSVRASEAALNNVPEQLIRPALAEYRLSKYDVINLAIIGLDESNFKNIMIGPDGYVNLPYAGTVRLAGLTVAEATDLLKEKLGEYIKIPDMAVMISSYGVRKVYVMGEVGKQGIYELNNEHMNVFAAISSAGGIAKKGRPKHIAVVRTVKGKVHMQEVDFDRFIKKQDASQNLALLDGDMVYVPTSNKISLMDDIMPIVNTFAVFRSLTD